MAASSDFEMEYRLLGKTGLQVSVLGLGGMTFDTVDQTRELLQCVREYGVNFFDNAEAYGNPIRGISETNFGLALKALAQQDPKLWRRSDLVITTKLFFGPQAGDLKLGPNRGKVGKNEMGLSRKHLVEGMEDALRRMQLDYVDVVYAHRPDYLTSIEEIVRSFNFLIESGYAFHWGTSMWKPVHIAEAHWVARELGMVGPCVEQPKYSMFDRGIVEHRYLDLYKPPYNMGTTIWNALDTGVLTGKYNDRSRFPKGGRLSGGNLLGAFAGNAKHVTDEKVRKVEQLMKIAKELGISMAQLAIGWLIKNGDVTVCILGATKTHQLRDSMGAIKAANLITKDYIKRIETILDNKPKKGPLDGVMTKNKKIISRL